MPAFILDMGTPVAARDFASLDSFTQGYVEAAFWTEEDELSGATFACLAPDTLSRIEAECKAFCEANDALLTEAEEHRETSYLGHDFWLSRNGHGTGFWDRDLGAVGDKLHTAAEGCGEHSLYLGDDGQVYDT